ncbi:MAG: hypothetical protein JO089_04020 [Alphaproteobacteria bacterium]|nr:hypothetical protein [Alphaproteobacteria bacterium]
MKARLNLLPLLTLALAACNAQPMEEARTPHDLSGQLDMHIHQVVPAFSSEEIHFAGASAIPYAAGGIEDADGIMPDAVTQVTIYIPAYDARRDARTLALKRTVRRRGIPGSRIAVIASPELKAGDYRIDYAYNRVVTPPCDRWSGTEVSNYANVMQPNIGCALATNTGQMVADPRDLLRGHGDVRPDPDLDALAIQQYRAGPSTSSSAAPASSYSPSNAAPSSGASSAGGGGSSSLPAPGSQ